MIIQIINHIQNKKMCNDEIKERAEKYLNKAKVLFENLTLTVNTEESRKFYEMAMNYYNDALYFYGKGNFIGAIIALEYAEGWFDAGKFIKFLK